MFRKCEGNAGEAVEQEGKICDEVEAVRELIYLDHMLVDVRLLLLPRQDVGGGLCLGNVKVMLERQ